METTNVTLRMDKDLKEEADRLFADLGLNMSSAVNLFVRKAIRVQGIPFEIKRESGADAAQQEAVLVKLVQLLASDNTQENLSALHAGSPIDTKSVLSVEDI